MSSSESNSVQEDGGLIEKLVEWGKAVRAEKDEGVENEANGKAEEGEDDALADAAQQEEKEPEQDEGVENEAKRKTGEGADDALARAVQREEKVQEEKEPEQDAKFAGDAKEFAIHRFNSVFEKQFDVATDPTNFPIHHCMAKLMNLEENCKTLKLVPVAVDVPLSNAWEDAITEIQNQLYTDGPLLGTGTGLIQSKVTVKELCNQMKAAKIEDTRERDHQEIQHQIQQRFDDDGDRDDVLEMASALVTKSAKRDQHNPVSPWDKKLLENVVNALQYDHLMADKSLEEAWTNTEQIFDVIKNTTFSSTCFELQNAWNDRIEFEDVIEDECASSIPAVQPFAFDALEHVAEQLALLQARQHECLNEADDLTLEMHQKSADLDEAERNKLDRKQNVNHMKSKVWQQAISQCKEQEMQIKQSMNLQKASQSMAKAHGMHHGNFIHGVQSKRRLKAVWRGAQKQKFDTLRECWDIGKTQSIFLEFEGGLVRPVNSVLEKMVDAFELKTWYLENMKPEHFWSAEGARYVVDHIVFARKLVYWNMQTSETESSESQKEFHSGLHIKFLLVKPICPAPRCECPASSGSM